jgi:hypothetical protein
MALQDVSSASQLPELPVAQVWQVLHDAVLVPPMSQASAVEGAEVQAV